MVSAAGSILRIENWETIYPAQCLPGGEQDVLCHRGVKKALRLGAVMRLAQNPHELGHHGLCGHIVSLQHLQIGFQAVAHMVDADVAALAGDLRCEDDEPPFRHPVPQAVKKAALLRQAAYAEALNDKRVISLQQKVGGGAVLPRRQLQKRYPGIQRVEKYRGGMAVRRI